VLSTLASLSPGNIFTNEVLLVPLASYMDGANTEGRAMTLTCIAATEAVWPEIEMKWLQAKKQYGDPDYIHFTDLMALEGIYKGWSVDQRNDLVRGLIEALSSFMDHPQFHSFTCRVNLAAYDRWKVVRKLPNPARFCARIAFAPMVDWFYLPEQGAFVDVIDMFFDRNEPFMRHIRADWQSTAIRKKYPLWNLVRVIEDVEMKKTPPLQIADMVCWGFHRQGTYTHPQPWVVDFENYTIAVRASNAVRGEFREVGESALAHGTFREEGQALIELWTKKGVLVPNPSEEYKRFDKTMRQLIHVPHSEIKAALEAEKQAKQNNKKRKAKPSASGHADDDKD
jgi:hypothetical protein